MNKGEEAGAGVAPHLAAHSCRIRTLPFSSLGSCGHFADGPEFAWGESRMNALSSTQREQLAGLPLLAALAKCSFLLRAGTLSVRRRPHIPSLASISSRRDAEAPKAPRAWLRPR